MDDQGPERDDGFSGAVIVVAVYGLVAMAVGFVLALMFVD